MEHIFNLLYIAFRYLKDNRNHLTLFGISCIIFFLWFLLILSGTKEYGKEGTESNNTITTPTMVAATTKWWIKKTVTPLDTALGESTRTASTDSWITNCPEKFSPTLKPNIYAYISLRPPIPNRVRSVAGLSSSYLGQIEPGSGLKVINGPLCTDGYSWWLVEANQSGLRGWTVEGKRSEQWILPCPDPNTACSQTITPTPEPLSLDTRHLPEAKRSDCKSDKIAVGMLTQVKEDSLLILRAEPYTGEVIGRAGPLSVAQVIEGPTCTGNTIWWKLNVFDLDLTGWATENGLEAR